MQLILGDCQEELKKLEPNSIDAMITDPPAAIAFMNKAWDGNHGSRDNWIKWLSEIFRECGRVLKPGAHVLVWALPKTSHWTAMALEDADFEIRDVITHLFGSGFPKSLDISKAIDKKFGKKRNRWQGYGTALKPACEYWILARVPFSQSTVADNVLKWDTGGINIAESRIGNDEHIIRSGGRETNNGQETNLPRDSVNIKVTGRFPSNLVLSHHPECEYLGEKKVGKGKPTKRTTDPKAYFAGCGKQSKDGVKSPNTYGAETVDNYKCHNECAVRMLDEQSGVLKSGAKKQNYEAGKLHLGVTYKFGGGGCVSSTGGASRFFYCAKPSKEERNAGLNTKAIKVNDGRKAKVDSPFQRGETPKQNFHPTVKPIKLMKYLIRMITPKNGIVLDPFMGSGTSGRAANKAGFEFIGIEKNSEYFEIAEARIKTP